MTKNLDSAIRIIYVFYKVDCHANPQDLLAITKYYKFAFDSQSIRATNHNRSNGGSALDYFYLKPAKIGPKSIKAVF